MKKLDELGSFSAERAEPIFYSFLTDIRDRKRMEQRLKEKKYLSQHYLDLMAYDINNYNQSIMGYLELALDRVKSEGARKYIKEAIDDVKKKCLTDR